MIIEGLILFIFLIIIGDYKEYSFNYSPNHYLNINFNLKYYHQNYILIDYIIYFIYPRKSNFLILLYSQCNLPLTLDS